MSDKKQIDVSVVNQEIDTLIEKYTVHGDDTFEGVRSLEELKSKLSELVNSENNALNPLS